MGKRITLYLGDDTMEALETLSEKYHMSKSEIVDSILLKVFATEIIVEFEEELQKALIIKEKKKRIQAIMRVEGLKTVFRETIEKLIRKGWDQKSIMKVINEFKEEFELLEREEDFYLTIYDLTNLIRERYLSYKDLADHLLKEYEGKIRGVVI